MRIDVSSLLRPRLPSARPSSADDGVVLGQSLDGGAVLWPTPSRAVAGHVAIAAQSGVGKTIALLSALSKRITIETALAPERRPSYVLFDPKNDCLALIDAIALRCPSRIADVVVLDPFVGIPSNLAKLNLRGQSRDAFARIIAQLVGISSTSASSASSGTGARQSQLIYELFRCVLSSNHPHAHPLLCIDALRQSTDGFKRLASLAADPAIQQSVATLHASPELVASTTARLDILAFTEVLACGMAAPTCIDPTELIGPGKIVIFAAGNPPFGSSHVIATQLSIFATLFINAALARRSNSDDPMLTLAFDESALQVPVLGNEFITLLQTGRSRGVATCFLFQNFQVLASQNREFIDVLFANSRILAGKLSADDAAALVRGIGPRADVSESVATIRARVQTEICSLPPREFVAFDAGVRRRFRSCDEDLAAWRRAAEQHRAEIVAVTGRMASAVPQRPPVRLTELVPDVPKAKSSPQHGEARRQPGRSPWR